MPIPEMSLSLLPRSARPHLKHNLAHRLPRDDLVHRAQRGLHHAAGGAKELPGSGAGAQGEIKLLLGKVLRKKRWGGAL